MISLDKIEGFDWDEGNFDKNWKKHNISNFEAEQIFFNEPIIVTDDEKHSDDREKRYAALGRTDGGANLSIVFTTRGKLLRIISARKMSKNERIIYNEEIKKNTKIQK